MSELSQEARSLIEGASRADDPTAMDRERIRNRLSVELGAAAFATTVASVGTASSVSASAGVSPSAGVAAASTGTVKAGLFGGLGKFLAAASLVGTLGTSGVLMLSGSPAPSPKPAEAPRPVVVQHAPIEQAPAPLPPQAALPEAPAATPALAETKATVTSKPNARTARSKPAAELPRAGSELGAEVALLSGAQWALRHGQPEQALSMAREHATRFPQGELREERAGVEALARCALGQDGARVVAELERNAPASPLLSRVRTACGVP